MKMETGYIQQYFFESADSTQSIDIVNQFSPDSIIVCDNDSEETAFKRLDDMDLSVWQNDYSLGELWEKNVFGGNP